MRTCLSTALLIVFVVGSWPDAVLAQPGPRRISQAARLQIESLDEEKRSRSPRQRKLSSRLIHAARMRRGQPITKHVAKLRTGVRVRTDGTTLVDIRADVSADLLAHIEELGGQIVAAVPRLDSIRARLPLADIEGLADMTAVRAIRPADRAFTRMVDTSEGDIAHRADLLRSTFGIDGSGIAIGVLSDGVDTLTARQATGDLPATVTVLPGQSGTGDEGTAMLEIVFDLAPGADLLFATAFSGQASFATNILALRAAGADVIVDDIGYFAEAVFQDDSIAEAVDTVSADGALYVSAAGNFGNLNDGTSGVWEGDFDFTGATLSGVPAHDYDGLGTILNEITLDSPHLFTLQWADPQGGSGNDYDLYLLNAAGTSVVASSTDLQDGNDDPLEAIDSEGINDTGRQLVIARASGVDRFIHLNSNAGELGFSTFGQTSGHPAAQGAIGVASVRWSNAGGPGGSFDGSESIQTYSSDGPRRVFYRADGTAYTPGDFSATGGELRLKPDLTGADCVSTSTPGFGTFCGTSAAAPHLAAIAALLLERGFSSSQVVAAMKTTALDIEAVGVDRDSGSGIVDAFAAADLLLPALGPVGIALLVAVLGSAGARAARVPTVRKQ